MSDFTQHRDSVQTLYQAQAAGMPVPSAQASPPQGGDRSDSNRPIFVKAHCVSAVNALSNAYFGNAYFKDALLRVTGHADYKRIKP